MVSDNVMKTLNEMEKEHIILALRETSWNVTLAARLINVPRATMYRMMRKYGIKREQV